MRDYVARLKGEKNGRDAKDGQRANSYQATDRCGNFTRVSSRHVGEKIPLDEFIAHLQRLEATDAVDILGFSTRPARNRARKPWCCSILHAWMHTPARCLVAAKKESKPDGPGHLLLSHVRDGKFKLDQGEAELSTTNPTACLWSADGELYEAQFDAARADQGRRSEE